MLTNSGVRPSAREISAATSTSKPTSVSGWLGSASTNGAPPSGSPAQRNTRGGAAALAAEQAISHDTHEDATATNHFLYKDLVGRFVCSWLSWDTAHRF